MESVKVQITPGGPASRVEVIIRIFYGAIAGFILGIFMGIAGIVVCINFFTCLILAKRVGIGFVSKIIVQMTKLYAYSWYITDERPPIIPDF